MDLQQLLGVFGGAGVFIWYLLNRERFTNEQIVKTLKEIKDSSTDLTLLMLDLLDRIDNQYIHKRRTKELRKKLKERSSK